MTKKEVLKIIREKYPQYNEIPDDDLADLVSKKFPQYEGFLTSPEDKILKELRGILDEIKKKEIKIEPKFEPKIEIKQPEIKLPEIKIPPISIPKIEVPKVEIPPFPKEINSKIVNENAIPVFVVNEDGSPFKIDPPVINMPEPHPFTYGSPSAVENVKLKAGDNVVGKIKVVDSNGTVIDSFGGASDGVIKDGVDTSIKATVKDLANSNPLAVGIVDANGDQITSFGGGTQYTDGDVDATPTGTAAMVLNAATNELNVVSSNNPMPITGEFEVGGVISEGSDVTLTNPILVAGENNLGLSEILNIDSGGNLMVAQQGAVTVSATDLDIRNLSQTQDSILAYGSDDGGTTKRVIKTDSGGAVQVDIESGTVSANAGTGTFTTKEIRSATPTTSQVADNAASTTILASNANRLGASIQNDSSAVLYLKLGSTAATATDYTARLVQYGYFEVPFGYTGQINGIWASDPGDGAARVTELTA